MDFAVSNPIKIAWIIQSLQDDRQLIDVAFSYHTDGARSMIIDVDSDTGYFYLDEFASKECHRLASQGEMFIIRSSLNGVDVKIPELASESVVKDPQGALYKIAMPSTIYYAQRRDTYRARVSGLMETSVDVTSEIKGEKYQAKLIDISSGGCRIEISAGYKTFHESMNRKLDLLLHLSGEDESVQITAKIRHTQYLQRSRIWLLGCQFEKLEQAQQQSIDRFVAEMQRLERQKQALFA